MQEDLLQFVLNLLVDYGHEDRQKSKIDPDDDPFRVSLVCTLLDTVKPYLRQKRLKPFTHLYMHKFQRYS